MPRLVRRKLFRERIASMLNPIDFLLWLSEEIETREWDSKLVGTQFGLFLNLVFLLVRANSRSEPLGDDIFGDEGQSGLWSFLAHPLIWSLVAFSLTNAVYTMNRTRKYRLFEADIDVQPSIPSARRVKVQSSPVSSSLLRFIADMVSAGSAEARAHPDKNLDVWEVAVWDPLPISVRLSCLFGPGHVLIYMLSFPIAPLDPHPSVTVLKTMVVQLVLSAQLLLLSSQYAQQSKDSALIQKEVMHEYDTKYVQPQLHPIVRDVGTQCSENQSPRAQAFVQTGTPTTLIRRSFKVRDNPHSQPRESSPIIPQRSTPIRKPLPSTFTPLPTSTTKDFPSTHALYRSPVPHHSLPAGAMRSPTPMAAPEPSQETHLSSSTGGHMGIHMHNKSPLKKAISMGAIGSLGQASPRNLKEMAAYEQRHRKLPSSPTNRFEPRKLVSAGVEESPHPFANMGKHRPQYERYPSRW